MKVLRSACRQPNSVPSNSKQAVAMEGKAESYGWGSNSTQEAQFSVLDAITASELINDIEALFE